MAYADDASMALNSVHVMRPRDDRPDAPSLSSQDLRRLMAWLNTSMATELYLAMYAESQASFPQVKVTWLRTIPVPWPFTHHEKVLADAWVDRLEPALLTALDGAVRRRLAVDPAGARE